MDFKKILKNTLHEARRLKKPLHEARKLRLDLHRTGYAFKSMAKDPTATTGEKLKNYTYGSMTHGLRNAVKYGTKAAEAGTNKFKDVYNSSAYVKPIIQGQLNVKREVGNIVKNNPVNTTLGGLATLEGGRRLLKDDEDDKDSQSLTTNLSESENMLANRLKQMKQLKQNTSLQESSYSEPKEGTFYDKVFNSKKTVPDNPDNSSISNLSSKTDDLRYKSEKDTDKEVEEIPTQGGEEPKESLNENQSGMESEEVKPFNIHSKLRSILEAAHSDNPELGKNEGWTLDNRNKLAKDLKSLRKTRDKDRRKADFANSSEVKDWRNKTANTADNLARELSSNGGNTQSRTTPFANNSRTQYGNSPRIAKTATK